MAGRVAGLIYRRNGQFANPNLFATSSQQHLKFEFIAILRKFCEFCEVTMRNTAQSRLCIADGGTGAPLKTF